MSTAGQSAGHLLQSVGPRSTPTLELESSPPDSAIPNEHTGEWGDHVPLRTASPESLLSTPPPPPPPPPESKRWKGKERARDVPDDAAEDQLGTRSTLFDVREMDVGGSSPHNAEGQQQSLVSPVYPPAADEAIEERKVSETLKRWELLERQRRKVARESRNSVISADAKRSSGSQSGDVHKRGSLFWSSGKSRKPAPGSQPLPSVDAYGDISLSGEDYAPPPESEDVAVVSAEGDEGIALDERAKQRFIQRKQPHKATSSVDSHISDSSIATITPESRNTAKVRVEITVPTPSTSSRTLSDPFADPSSYSSPEKVPRKTPSTTNDPFSDERSPSAKNSYHKAKSSSKSSLDIAQPRPQHPPTAGALGLKRPLRYPTPKPLGLPLTVAQEDYREIDDNASEPNTDDSSQHPDEEAVPKQDIAKNHEEDEKPEAGRWWTDWLCGCSEGPDRGGDIQSGRTNPYE